MRRDRLATCSARFSSPGLGVVNHKPGQSKAILGRGISEMIMGMLRCPSDADRGGACMHCGQWAIGKRIDIATRDSERENDILADYYGALSAEGGMPTSLEWLFSWSWHHGRGTKRLELGYRQFSPLVSEIDATFEYIDFEGPPDRPQITKIGGYPTGSGSEACGRADIIPHIMAPFGNDA
ncbi:MAG: hypothetical protein KA002_01525 [Firmicutes bacterium]|nr:hypothetical protein [Bacillota bacterium]